LVDSSAQSNLRATYIDGDLVENTNGFRQWAFVGAFRALNEIPTDRMDPLAAADEPASRFERVLPPECWHADVKVYAVLWPKPRSVRGKEERSS
jgi:hypothetical protein